MLSCLHLFNFQYFLYIHTCSKFSTHRKHWMLFAWQIENTSKIPGFARVSNKNYFSWSTLFLFFCCFFLNRFMSPARWLSIFMPSLGAIRQFPSPGEHKKCLKDIILDLWHHFRFSYITFNSPMFPVRWLFIVMPSLGAIGQFPSPKEPKKCRRSIFRPMTSFPVWLHYF